ERLRKDWRSPIYSFFQPTPDIIYVDGRRIHAFRCAAKNCLGKGREHRTVKRYLDTLDSKSTGNLRKHAKICWSDATVKAADNTKDLATARGVIKEADGKLRDGMLTAKFERALKGGTITYSHWQYTKTETKYCGFVSLMKTGRPGYYIPSLQTVSRDVKWVFVKSCQRIAKMLREHEGAFHFGTDAWTSPNHKAYVAVTVHYEFNGVPISMLLDLVEVPKSHSGVNLAAAF
ncbi:hypothetical protein HYPSUDRAFT_124166, partial [Hypholoma sublateritium FD-334 SS-4]